MRIEGFVPVPMYGEPIWRLTDEQEPMAWYLLCDRENEPSVEKLKRLGWRVVRVGDVDSIRDEVLEEAAKVSEECREYFEKAYKHYQGRCFSEEEYYKECHSVAVSVREAIRKRIRAMKSKP